MAVTSADEDSPCAPADACSMTSESDLTKLFKTQTVCYIISFVAAGRSRCWPRHLVLLNSYQTTGTGT